MKEATPKSIIIRDLDSYADLEQVEAVEREVWGLADRDVIPLTLIIATKEAGSIWVGAFDGLELAGFAFGFLGMEHGSLILHSHMLAVREPYRDLDLGRRLKLAQRERALTMRIQEMTWTFDRLQGKDYRPEVLDAFSRLQPLVQFNGDGRPLRNDLSAALARQRIAIQIPSDIGAVEQKDLGLAREWRQATRWAFTEALRAGFFVAEFCRTVRGQQGPGNYLLEKGSIAEYVPELQRKPEAR